MMLLTASLFALALESHAAIHAYNAHGPGSPGPGGIGGHAAPISGEKPSRVIAIEINGTTLDTDTPPLVLGGRVLFPLREVFDALGIGVTRAGNTITARLPTGSVRFSVGSASAQVNGRTVFLEAATIDRNGTTYAPLQLLVDAFGAQASYDQRTDRVEIVSAYVGRNSAAEQERSGGGSDVQGVVAAIDSDSDPPSLTVVRGGTSRTISVTSDAKIWTEDVTIHSQLKGSLDDVRVGDALHAILAADGRVVSVFDFFKSTSGTVTAVSPSALVLENGRVVTPSAQTEISLNSAAAHLSDLQVGDFVTVRSNPESGELRTILASRALAMQPATAPPTASAANVTIANVELNVARPLRAGETFDVLMHGTPGGHATFEIGDYLTGLAMEEHSSGFYSGHFTIPDRFNVTQVPVYVRLTVGTNDAPRAQAPQTLSAATIPPAFGEVAPPSGQVVNNSRPSIFATYSAPTEIGINQSSVSISVNGHDATSVSTRSAGFVTYSPGIDLPDGPVTVVVRVSDAAGNTATKTWTFTIKTR
jgi:hypothetical protein